MSELTGEFDHLEQAYTKQYDLGKLVDNYAQKWADTKQALATDADVNSEYDRNHQQRHADELTAEQERHHQQRHADTEDAIRQVHGTLMDHINESPAIEIIRDETGRASHVRKGERILTIHRGPDGRAIGLR